MSAGKVDASELNDAGITWTLLATLYLRAYESRHGGPILGDHYAAEAVDRIDYDFAALHKRLRPQSNQYLVALRVKQLDDWAADFLARHPDATVLHLACGLDGRALRLAPPATVRWYDVDIPKVIDLRRQLYPERDGYQMIGASVTDTGWLDQVPRDRPTLVVAEGLLQYLEERDVRQLLGRLTDHFGSGELIFDAIAPWAARLVKVFRSGVRDGRQVEQWNPRLTCAEQVSFGARYQRIPMRRYRIIYQIGNAIPAWRTMLQNFRFTF